MKLKPVLTIVMVVSLLALVVWGFKQGRKESAMEREREHPVQAPSRVTVQDGEAGVALDAQTLARSGIMLAPLKELLHRPEEQAYGTVLAMQELATLRSDYLNAQAQIDKAQARLAASRQEYERLKALRDDDRNVTDRAVQAAEAVWHGDEADVRAAHAVLQSVELHARQQWGEVIERWLRGAPELERMLAQREFLIQVTLPAGVVIAQAPPAIQLQGADGSFITATRVSAAPHTDTRLQGASYFYRASAPWLLPGMSMTAYVPVGAKVHGVTVPAAAVVWWQGRAWVYVQRAPEHYARREIAIGQPLDDGWFVTQGLTAADTVVVRGAQQLLSEELRSQIHMSEEGDQK